MSTLEAIRTARRKARPLTLPEGVEVHVRSITLGELRGLGGDDNTRSALKVCALALVEPDGTPCYPAAGTEELDEIEANLTPEQIEAVCAAVVPRKADAKND